MAQFGASFPYFFPPAESARRYSMDTAPETHYAVPSTSCFPHSQSYSVFAIRYMPELGQCKEVVEEEEPESFQAGDKKWYPEAVGSPIAARTAKAGFSSGKKRPCEVDFRMKYKTEVNSQPR